MNKSDYNRIKASIIAGVTSLGLLGIGLSIVAVTHLERKQIQYSQTQDSLSTELDILWMKVYQSKDNWELSDLENIDGNSIINYTKISYAKGDDNKSYVVEFDGKRYDISSFFSAKPKYDHPDSLRSSIGRLERQLEQK